MSATTITALRELCTACDSYATDKFVGNQRLYARNLNVEESNAARRGILESSQMGEKGLMTIFTNAIDGAEFKWEEPIPALVQSRSTGGLSKTQCGFDPQSMKVKHHLKRQFTERLYIHRAECMLKYIGSTYQGTGSGPRYIGDSDNLLEVAANTDLVVDLFVNDARAFAKAIDGTVILGNFTGDDQSGIVNNGLSSFPHFDGVLKQVSQNANGTYYATVDVTLPTVGSGAYFVKWYGTWLGTDTTLADIVTLINSAVDEKGDTLFSAYAEDTDVIRITANNPEQEVYGMGLLEIFYASDATVDSCDLALDATIVENPMPYSEEPLLFDYTETIAATNFYEYFRDVIKAWKKHISQLSENGMQDLFGGQSPYIAIDPLLAIDKEFAFLEELASGYNAEMERNELERIIPRLEPIKQLEGTGLWFMTYPSNIIFLTNMDGTQPQMSVWHDKDCDQVKGRMEMLGNVLVVDHAAFACNVKNSPFENILTTAYRPENLPHLTPEVRDDAVAGYSEYQSRAAARVTVEANGSDWDVRLVDTSRLAQGRSISTYEWVFYVATGTGAIQPASQVADVTTTFTTAQLAAVVNVALTITLDNGDTDIVLIPRNEFIDI